MLCTSGFMGDVTFDRNGPFGDAWKAEPQPTTVSGVAVPGQSDVYECLVYLFFSATSSYTKT